MKRSWSTRSAALRGLRTVGVVAAVALVVAGCGSGGSESSPSASSSASGGQQSSTSAAASGSSATSGSSGSSQATDGSGSAATDSGGQHYTFALVSHGNPGDSFWATVENGAKAAAKRFGVTVTYQASGGDPQKQVQLVNAAVANKVDGLIVSLANPDALKAPLKAAEAKGIPVITINSGASDFQNVGALTHVGQDETVAGEAAGTRLNSAGLKKILCVIHEQNNVGLQDRCNGAKKTFKGQVVNIQVPGTGDITGTEASLKAKLLADPSIDGVLTLNPDIAAAAEHAITEANSKAKLATFDLSTDVLKDIQDGKILFAISQEPYIQGYMPVVMLYLYVTNADVIGGGHPVYSGPAFITKDNAAQVAKLVAAGTHG